MADTRPVIEELSEAECGQLLAAHHFGRLAVISGDHPVIFPVNYVYDAGRVVIRTDPGTKLSSAAQNRVAFEIDETQEAARTGWSVLVVGTGYDVTDALDSASLSARRIPLHTWAPGDKDHWIRIEPTAVSGRRVRPG
ncbi:MAG TPA: pyridoxamine 5'-phosphate oxidase family protein [Acidimicrobiales bacterium]|nr:pyridoxamine 5'-phosphate oxidase family protein [Acidimicrobiales bacterium]